MKKGIVRLLAITLAVALLFSFAACGGNGGDDTTVPTTAPIPTKVDIGSLNGDGSVLVLVDNQQLVTADGKSVTINTDTKLSTVKDETGKITGLALEDGTIIAATSEDGNIVSATLDAAGNATITFPAGDATTIPGETTTVKDGETTTAAVTTTAPALVAPVNGTVDDIVKFYNSAANASKASKDKVTIKKVDGTSTTLESTNLPKVFKFVEGIAEDMLPNDYPRTSEETFVGGKSTTSDRVMSKYLPPDDEVYMSALTPAGVKSATCVADGKGWKIVIKIKSETVYTLNEDPPYHSSCVDTLDLKPEDLGDFALDSATFVYSGATITAKVNAAGKLDSFDVSEPMRIEGDMFYTKVSALKIHMVVTGEWKQAITFTW